MPHYRQAVRELRLDAEEEALLLRVFPGGVRPRGTFVLGIGPDQEIRDQRLTQTEFTSKPGGIVWETAFSVPKGCRTPVIPIERDPRAVHVDVVVECVGVHPPIRA